MSSLASNEENDCIRLKSTCYLDFIGAGLCTDSQIETILADLKNTLYGNPHSSSFSGSYCRDAIDQIRYRILDHFGTSNEEYDVVFTSGATQSLRTVVECFDWTNSCDSTSVENSGHFVYLRDNHTSVLGLREIIDQQQVNIRCLEHEQAFTVFGNNGYASENVYGNSLFVYSAQCNFSGCKYPLSWIQKSQNGVLDEFIGSGKSSKWFCLLDAASFVPTSELNLRLYPADFVAISFYKMFGYPTGLGALLVRKSSSYVLQKRYYGGGTILMTLSNELFHKKRENLSERFEDGTVNFLAIISLRHGFDSLLRSEGNMKLLSLKVFSLAQYLHRKFLMLHHANGEPAVKLYCDTDYSDSQTQGGVVNFNLLRSDGRYIGYSEVLHIANLFGIQLRTGCFCNPGACQRHLNLSNNQLKKNLEKGHTCAENIDLIDGLPTGSIRVSFGYLSTKTDADKLLDTIIECFVLKPIIYKIPTTWSKKAQILKEKFEYFNGPDLISSSNEADAVKTYSSELNLESTFLPEAKLLKIYIYPVKSCGAVDVSDAWPVTKTGLKYDREWMIISGNGIALTQKQAPKMCLIVPRVCLLRQVMILEFKDVNGITESSITVNVDKVSTTSSQTTRLCHSKVCGDQVTVIDWGDDVAEWLQNVLQIPELRLVKIIGRSRSPTDVALSLSSQAQYLLITKSSVQWLCERNSTSVVADWDNMMRRFRSNFVIGGDITPLEESNWKFVDIGKLRFKVDGPCNRCYMICINQSSGEKNREPLTALASAQKGNIKFGIYLSLNKMEGSFTLRNGDSISVVRHFLDDCQ